MTNTNPEARVVEAVARAIWDTWCSSPIASDVYKDCTWNELNRLATTNPDGNAAMKLRDLALKEARAAITAHTKALAAEGMVIVPKYIFDTDGRCDGRPRIIDLCYTAFDIAKGKNDEDGGATDWFNDTKPRLDKAIAALPTPTLPPAGDER